MNRKNECRGRASARVAAKSGRARHARLPLVLSLMLHGLPAYALFGASAIAQESNAEAVQETPEQEAVELDRITVTAVRERTFSSRGALGARSDLDTPFSISSVNAEELAKRQANTLAMIFSNDAAVSRASGSDYNAGSSQMSVRGMLLDYGDNYRINGIPFNTFGTSLPVEAMEEIQLLKGASGFMYGFAPPGGIVNYVTKIAPDYPMLTVSAGYRSETMFDQSVDMGGPLGQNGIFGYRLNVVNEQGRTYSESENDRKAVSLALSARPSDRLEWTTNVIYQERKFWNMPVRIGVSSFYEGAALPSIGGVPLNNGSRDSFNKSKFLYGGTGLKWNFSENWNLAFDLAKTDTQIRYPEEYAELLDSEGNYENWTGDWNERYQSDFGQAMLQGKFATGNVQHQLVAGASWERKRSAWGSYDMFAESFNVERIGNIYTSDRLVWSPYVGPQSWSPVYDGRTKALFVSDTIEFSPHWQLLAGLRYTDYSDVSWTREGVPGDYSQSVVVAEERYETTATTPTVALLYKPTQESTLYASYVEALEPGFTVGPEFENAREMLDPTMSKQYEIGMKWDRKVFRLEVAAYRLQRAATYVTEDNQLLQDGLANHDGLELSGQLRLGNGLVIGPSLLFTNAKYKRVDVPWLEGREVEGATDVSGALKVEYNFPNVAGLYVYGDARYTGNTVIVNHEEYGEIRNAGRTVFAAGFGYSTDWGKYPFTVRGSIENLLDKKYWHGNGYTISHSVPRHVALTMSIDFY